MGAPRGLQGGSEGAGGGAKTESRKSVGAFFLNFDLRIVFSHIMLKSKFFKIVHKSESACHGGIFGPSIGRQQKKQRKQKTF